MPAGTEAGISNSWPVGSFAEVSDMKDILTSLSVASLHGRTGPVTGARR